MKAFTMYPESFVSVNNMLADILVEGVALKYWQSGIVMFSMNNWCGWTSNAKVITKDTTKELVSKEYILQALSEYADREGIKLLSSN